MRVLIATFSYNRPNLLRLCTEWLLRDRLPDFQVEVFDDASDDPAVLEYLKGLKDQGVESYASTLDQRTRTSYRDRAMRCASLRRQALDACLARDFDYVVFKDDDVLVSCQTILEAIQDFEFLKGTDYAQIGALTLHGLVTHQGYLSVNDKVFSELQITGEAHVIMSSEALMVVGNHFDSVPGGFADTQFNALRRGGFTYYDRVWPPYHVQHLGFGPDGSIVHQRDRNPVWTREAYSCTYPRRDPGVLLEVPDFDLEFFTKLAQSRGGEKAAGVYLRERSL